MNWEPPQYSPAELQRMQREAIQRVEEMQKKNSTLQMGYVPFPERDLSCENGGEQPVAMAYPLEKEQQKAALPDQKVHLREDIPLKREPRREREGGDLWPLLFCLLGGRNENSAALYSALCYLLCD